MVERIRSLLEQAHHCLDNAICSVEGDAEAATDDMIAARLLIATVLLTLPPLLG